MERILLISLLRTAYYYSVLLQSVTDKLLLPVVHIPVNAVSYSSGGRHGLSMYRNILNDVQGKCHFLFSGDPEKKSEEFMWIGKTNQQGKIIIKFSKQTEIRKLRVYNYPLLKSVKQHDHLFP